MDDGAAYRAILERSREHDFVFAVKTTGIYCRPSCPARRPKRVNVRFFATPAEAEAAGFRPCKRCRPRAPRSPSDALVARAKAALDRAGARGVQLTLAALADEVSASPFHLQRAFKKAVGVSPRAYGEAARVARFREEAPRARTVLDAAHAAGFGSGRAVAAAPLGMTPSAFRKGGAGERVGYAVVATRLGRLLVAAAARGIVRVALGDRARDLVEALRVDLPRAALVRDASLGALAHRIAEDADDRDIPLELRGTALELRVWDALRRIPRGETRTYTEIAAAIGSPRAVRAVARACARNPVALLVPCHRVVRKDGDLAGYRWGLARKERLLEEERAPIKARARATPARSS